MMLTGTVGWRSLAVGAVVMGLAAAMLFALPESGMAQASVGLPSGKMEAGGRAASAQEVTELIRPIDVAIGPTGDLLVTDDALDAVVRVDPESGAASILSSSEVGSGPGFESPRGIAVMPNGLIAVTDIATNDIIEVDPVTGDRSLIVDDDIFFGLLEDSKFQRPLGIAVDPFSNNLYVTDYTLGQIVLVNPDHNSATVMISPEEAALPENGDWTNVLDSPVSVTVDPETGLLFVVDATDPYLLRVEARSNEIEGAREGFVSVVETLGVGQGPQFEAPRGISINEMTREIYVSDAALDAIVVVDPATGDRTVLSGDNIGGGPTFAQPYGLTVARDGTIIVADAARGTLISVDPRSGNRTAIVAVD